MTAVYTQSQVNPTRPFEIRMPEDIIGANPEVKMLMVEVESVRKSHAS
jgi:hypothetical protein